MWTRRGFLIKNYGVFLKKEGYAVQCPESKSIASGLAPPFAGENAYRHIKEFVESILLVTEDELRYVNVFMK